MEPQTEPHTNKNPKHRSRYTDRDTNRIMGMAAIFISILSVIAVIYQSYLAREENELIRIQQSASVLPYLMSWSSDIEGQFKFIIGNKGVGPAFIKEVEIVVLDNKSQDSLIFNNSDLLIAYIEEHSTLLDTTPGYTGTLRPDMLLSQDEIKEIVVYSYTPPNQVRDIRNAFESFDVNFKITYEDVYGSTWIYNSNEAAPRKL